MQHDFRLQNILGLRERERDTAAGAYREALLAKDKLLAHIEELVREHADQRPVQSQSVMGQVDTQKLIESQRYQIHLLQQANTLRAQMQIIESECDKRRLVLVKREQALNSIEKLKVKQAAQWQLEQAEAEQVALDQWAGFKYWREQRS